MIKKMYSPVTGKEMNTKTALKEIHYRGFDIVYEHWSYFCKDSGESFTTTGLDEINMSNIIKEYDKK